MKRLAIAAVGLVLAVGLFARDSTFVQAQPVATIALPEPGEAKELFAGCNLISLTFPDGTTSEEVIDAVTPPEAVETIWRQTAALDRFEGFSPVFPQASDLLTVHRLDPVWICISKTRGPLPPPVVATPTSVVATPTPGPTPAPTSGQLVDLAITGMHLQRPEGRVWIYIVNKGPNSLVNATAQLQCIVPSFTPFDDNLVAGNGFQGPLSLTLAVGQMRDLATALTIDVGKGEFEVLCEITNESFTDPNLYNNKEWDYFEPVADLALTDLFAPDPTAGELYARITNNGPDTLVNAPAQLQCSYTVIFEFMGTKTFTDPPVPITVSLVPGETEAWDTQVKVAPALGEFDVKCELSADYDPNKANNTHSVVIPAQTID